MNRHLRNRAGKYLKKLLFTITISLIATIIIASSLLYYGAEKAMVHLNKNHNEKILTQLRFHIDKLNDNLKNIAITQYFDHRNYALLHAEQIDSFDMLSRLRNLDRFIHSSPHLHSIVMYNAVQNQYYVGGPMEMSPENDPFLAEIERLIKSNEPIPKLQWVPFKVTDRHSSEEINANMFSMFMYEGDSQQAFPKSMLIVNVRAEWLFDNLHVLNELMGNDRGAIGIVDQKGTMIEPNTDWLSRDSAFMYRMMQQIYNDERDYGQFFDRDGDEDVVVTFMSTENKQWKIIIVQPYHLLVKPIHNMRVTSFITIVCIIFIALGCAFFISKRLYRPIQSLVKYIRPMSVDSRQGEVHRIVDELHYIAQSYRGMSNTLQAIRRDQDENRDIVKSYYTRTLILECDSLDAWQFKQWIQTRNLRIVKDGTYRLCTIHLDQIVQFKEIYSKAEQRLLRFAMQNIAEHIWSSKLQVEMIEVNDEMTAYLLSWKQTVEEPVFIQQAINIQETIRKYYRLSVTITYGNFIDDYRSLSMEYGNVQNMHLHRMIYGHAAVITPEMENGFTDWEHTVEQTDQLVKKLLEAICLKQQEDCHAYLEDIFQLMCKLPPSQMMYNLMTLLMSLRQALNELNKNRLKCIQVDWNGYTRKVTEIETLTEARELFHRLIKDWLDQQLNEQQAKQKVLVETIKEMVGNRYKDANLCLQSIADTLGMNSSHVSRLFRKMESIPVHEYIKQVRLKHALQLLETNDQPIAEIMAQVGYSNISNFFRHFKQHYGTTPNQYRLKNAIDNSKGNQVL